MDGKSRPRCEATRKDGQPCRAAATLNGFCIGHAPIPQGQRAEARRRGGQNKSNQARSLKMLPARLRPTATMLETVMVELYQRQRDPKEATAIASVAQALIRVVSAGELEARLRQVEEKVESKPKGS